MSINRIGTMSTDRAGSLKRQIRHSILLQLQRQKEEDRKRKSNVIKRKLFRMNAFKDARVVMFYIALKGEVDTLEMIKAAQRLRKMIVVPVCRKDRIKIRPCILDHRVPLKKGPYGVLEPAIERPVAARNVDLVLVPGVAFDTDGRRLGRGKGFYDRFLRTLTRQTTLIGMAFDFQVLPHVPAEDHDVAMHRVLAA